MKLLLPYAYDINGNLVHIDNAAKGHKYTCPICGAELMLKIGKIPEGQKYHRRNHFAHKGNSDNHCSESLLHKFFKEKCAEYISKKISSNEHLFYKLRCEKCNKGNIDNLIKTAVNVETEHCLGLCKPDIALLDSNNNVVVVIEIIVKHKPEFEALQYYEKNKIICLQIKIKDFSDCERDRIENILVNSEGLTIYPTYICESCNSMKTVQNPVTILDDEVAQEKDNKRHDDMYATKQHQINQLLTKGPEKCPNCGAKLELRNTEIASPRLVCTNDSICNFVCTVDSIIWPNLDL